MENKNITSEIPFERFAIESISKLEKGETISVPYNGRLIDIIKALLSAKYERFTLNILIGSYMMELELPICTNEDLEILKKERSKLDINTIEGKIRYRILTRLIDNY